MKTIRLLEYLGNYFALTDQSKVIAIQEAIAELEALQQHKSCDICKYSFYWENADVLECTVNKQYCYKCEQQISIFEVTKVFCCNRYEAKEQ